MREEENKKKRKKEKMKSKEEEEERLSIMNGTLLYFRENHPLEKEKSHLIHSTLCKSALFFYYCPLIETNESGSPSQTSCK
jgi:hypothetical protein